jgi:hypothetical protein
MSTVADIRDTHEVCIIINNKKIPTRELIIFRQLGSDFKQHNELQKIDPHEVNIQDNIGDTLLHICIRRGFLKSIALCLFLGADVHLTNIFGESPISILDIHKTHVPLPKNQASIQLLFQKSATLITITSALSCRVGKRSSLNLLPIELVRLLDVMLFEPVTQF